MERSIPHLKIELWDTRNPSSWANNDLDFLSVFYVLNLARKISECRSPLQCWYRSHGRINALFGHKRRVYRKQRARHQYTTFIPEALEPMQLKEFDRIRVNELNEFFPALFRVLNLSRFSRELQNVTGAQKELIAKAIFRNGNI